MGLVFDDLRLSSLLVSTLDEMEGQPNPLDEAGIDRSIREVMVAQRREINRKNLPILEN